MAWYKSGSIAPLLRADQKRIVCLDLETTGLSPACDEILQIALVRGDGCVLVNQKVRPMHRLSWPSAQKVHGISPQDVSSSQFFFELVSTIERIFLNSDVLVGYNLAFDEGFLRKAGIAASCKMKFDVMKEFAPVMSEANEKGEYPWVSLERCAKHYGVAFYAHDALSDARATLKCFFAMLHDGGDARLSKGGRSYLEVVSRYASG